MFSRVVRRARRVIGQLQPPSDAVQVACWRCRQLVQEAAQNDVRPADYKHWKATFWTRIGWVALGCVGVGVIAGFVGLGLALVGGVPVHRVYELSIGSWVLVTALGMGLGTWLTWEKSALELRKLRQEKAEGRRWS